MINLPKIYRSTQKNISPKALRSSKKLRRFSHDCANSKSVGMGASIISSAIEFFEEEAEKKQLADICSHFAQNHLDRFASKVEAKVRALNPSTSGEGDAIITSDYVSASDSCSAEEQTRDFSEIHRLAALHGAQKARREICKMLDEADQRRKEILKEQNRVQSIYGDFKQVQKGNLHKERCKYGSDCSKPNCTNLHPWDSEWADDGCPGTTSISRLNHSRHLYTKMRPISKYKRNMPPKSNSASSLPTANHNSEEISINIQAAEAIDNILSQTGIPDHVRKLARTTLFPHLLQGLVDVPPTIQSGIACRKQFTEHSCCAWLLQMTLAFGLS